MPLEGSMLQLYVQFYDKEARYEDYVCSIQYRYQDFGRVNDFNLWKGHYCGAARLESFTVARWS